MTDMAIDIQVKAEVALKQLAATDIGDAVHTRKLAKRLRLLGVRLDTPAISVALNELAPTPWGRRLATFIGGNVDPLDQYIWALPKE